MRAVIGLVMIGCCLAAVLAGASGARAEGPAASAPEGLPVPPSVLAQNGLEIVWRTDLMLDATTPLKNVWPAGDYLVGRASDNRVYVVNAITGVRLWSQQVATADETVWPPAVDKNALWFCTTTKLLGLRAKDGSRTDLNAEKAEVTETAEEEAEKPAVGGKKTKGEAKPVEPAHKRKAPPETVSNPIPLDFAPAGRPVTNGVHCFIPDVKGWLQAVSILPRLSSWGRWTEDVVSAGPVLDSAQVYFGSQNGVVYASAQNVRRVVWEHKTEGPIIADLKRTKSGLVLAASLDYRLYAFQGASGRLAWRYNAGEPLRKAPYAFGGQPSGKAPTPAHAEAPGQVFLFSQEAGLTSLNMTTGRPEWTLSEGADLLAADADTVYVLSRDGALLGVDRKDGTVKFTAPMSPNTIPVVNESDSGTVYLASPGGRIIAIAKKKEPSPEAPDTQPKG